MKSELDWSLIGLFSGVLAPIILVTAGCQNAPTSAKAGSASSINSPPMKHQIPQLGGAQLWAANCGHCHNIRSPDSYSDAQWEVVMLHMRVRANLTPEEHTKILAFLKSAH